MTNIKAVIFDNDGTLSHINHTAINAYHKLVESVSNKPFFIDESMEFFIADKLLSMGYNTNTHENEEAFFRAFYKYVLLLSCGNTTSNLSATSDEIFNIMWHKDKTLFPETLYVLKTLKDNGFKIGVLTDGHHKIASSLTTLDAIKYLDSFTSSSELNVKKPNPDIYYHALYKLGVAPNECIYIDDKLEDVISAQNLGFKAFRINRENTNPTSLDIPSLTSIIEILNINQEELEQ